MPARYQFTVHSGAEHGYSAGPRRHDKQATARDWGVIFAMFQRQIRHMLPETLPNLWFSQCWSLPTIRSP